MGGTVPDRGNYFFVLVDERIEIQELSTRRNQAKPECLGLKKANVIQDEAGS